MPAGSVQPLPQTQQNVSGETENAATAKQAYYADEKGNAYESSDNDDTDAPTEEEKQTLRRVSDTLPKSAFLVALVELCERFAYYGLTGPFQVRVLSDGE